MSSNCIWPLIPLITKCSKVHSACLYFFSISFFLSSCNMVCLYCLPESVPTIKTSHLIVSVLFIPSILILFDLMLESDAVGLHTPPCLVIFSGKLSDYKHDAFPLFSQVSSQHQILSEPHSWIFFLDTSCLDKNERNTLILKAH